MDSQINDHVSTARRVPVTAKDASRLVNVTSDYSLAGVTWDYYNTVYKMLDFAGNWPTGMAAHIAWPDAGQWRAIGLWDSLARVDDFFGRVAIERISQAVQLLGAVPNRDGATDVEPERHPVCNTILGPLARSFVNIGDDRDGGAIGVLGSEPIALQIDVSKMTETEYAAMIERLDYRASIPAELIAHFAATVGENMRIFEIWADSGHAQTTLGDSVLPQIDMLGAKLTLDMEADHRLHELRRIVFSDELVSAFGF